MVARAIAALWFVLLLASCAGARQPVADTGGTRNAITVASFNFAENVVVAEIYAQALEASGLPVERELELGPRELVEPALERGLVDVVPEYLGTALEFLTGGAGEATANVAVTHRRLEREFEERGIRVLAPAPAQDKNGVAVTFETKEQHELERISDLAPIAARMSFGGPPECPERPLCLPGLEHRYGLTFSEFVPLDASGPITAAALESGEVDVAVLFTTSGYIAAKGFVVLDDDRRLQPAENVTPVVRQDAIERHGGRVAQILDAVSTKLTTSELIELNRRVSLQGKPVGVVARAWLREARVLAEVESGA